ncbi:MAG: hypothetical protein N2323_00875 [candidate division WOR-3 bacterium]|nr:hypothetical protein [candidate division WOR-3 bacterium]MCX7836499.1 hypothetical protein [candidate division WOR-3 bacterium]MDW8114438.1 hypothetical protein [candidate division WOR-3 bacterium]
MKKFLILSLITFIPFFIFNQEEPISEETHYYLKEWINEDGLKEACLLEGDSIPPESIPEGFVKVSLEELHQKGYLTAEEWLEVLKAIPETVYIDPTRWAFSYVDCWYDTQVRYAKFVAISNTVSYNINEKIRVYAVLRKYVDGVLRSERSGSHTRVVKSGNYRASVSWVGFRSVGNILRVTLNGWHWWKWRQPDTICDARTYDEDWCNIQQP